MKLAWHNGRYRYGQEPYDYAALDNNVLNHMYIYNDYIINFGNRTFIYKTEGRVYTVVFFCGVLF